MKISNHNWHVPIDGSDEATKNCPFKSEQQLHGTCNQNSFQCDNGECINIDLLCDGSQECADGSDETVRYCAGTHCPSYAFRCGNGGCISGKKKCDNRVDCIDGSDENWALCGRNKSETITIRPIISFVPNTPVIPTATQVYNQSQIFVNPIQTVTTYTPMSNNRPCRADNIPNNGDAYYQYDQMQRVPYGDIVNHLGGIVYKCIENHYLIGNETNICINGRWRSSIPQCKPKCSEAEIQGITISANCFVNNTQKTTPCTRPVEPGTTAYVTCQEGYEATGPIQILTCGHNGRWSPTPQKCSQSCGEIIGGTSYVVGGQRTNVSNIPWHVGIFKRNSHDGQFQQICGGTIISSKVIVSAMVKH